MHWQFQTHEIHHMIDFSNFRESQISPWAILVSWPSFSMSFMLWLVLHRGVRPFLSCFRDGHFLFLTFSQPKKWKRMIKDEKGSIFINIHQVFFCVFLCFILGKREEAIKDACSLAPDARSEVGSQVWNCKHRALMVTEIQRSQMRFHMRLAQAAPGSSWWKRRKDTKGKLSTLYLILYQLYLQYIYWL